MIIRSPQQKKDRQTQPGDEHRIANRLRRYFAPASTFPPPGILRTQTGNRNVSQSAALGSNTTPTDNIVLQLIPSPAMSAHPGALANWRFSTVFTKKPTVTAVAQGANSTAPQELNVIQVSTTGAIIQSTDPMDTRPVHIHAIQS